MAAHCNFQPLSLQSILVMFFAGACLTLHGCGSGSGTTTPTTTATMTTTLTTTAIKAACTPVDGREFASSLNKQYYSFDTNNPNSGQGVYMRLAEDPTIYCGGKCFDNGVADCRVSGSMFNSKQMIHRSGDKTTIAMDFGKRVAWYVNETLLQTKLAKCSYAWDGGTMGKYNYGCGCNPGVMNCGPSGPYGNMDKDTGYTKKNTGDSNDVKSCACENKPESSWPKSWGHAPDCFWKGPAYYPEGGYVKDDTWNMVKWRVDHQEYSREDQGKDPVAFWNEVVVDAPELKKALAEDHLAAMPAIIYIKDSAGARDVAKSTAKFMADTYGTCSHQPAPTIAVDLNANVANNEDIFVYEPETESEISKPTVV